MNLKKEIGDHGEEIARRYLERKGFEILETNWLAYPKEIDIIALKDNILHIVEVKTRTYTNIASPIMAVSRQKQRNLVMAANNYIKKKNIDFEVSFDVIGIVYQASGTEIEFIPDAFYPLA